MRSVDPCAISIFTHLGHLTCRTAGIVYVCWMGQLHEGHDTIDHRLCSCKLQLATIETLKTACLSLPRNQTSRKPREVVGLPLLTLKAVKIQLPPLFRSFPGQPSGRQRWPFVTSYILWNSVIHCWFLYKLISSRIRSHTMQANTNTRH